jgi:hypothetical protein
LNDLIAFEYLYRDASNYKSWGTLLLKGMVSASDEEQIKSHFESGEFFIAEQLEIPPLYADLWEFSSGPTGEDHVWHTFCKLRPATVHERDLPLFAHVEFLMSKICAVTCWNPRLSAHWDN